MFDLSIEKILVLVLAALFVLGPERLPAAAAWAGRAIRQVKGFAAGAHEQVRAEMGPEPDQLRAPLAELRAPLQELRAPLQELRALCDPRGAVLRHLLAEPTPAAAANPEIDVAPMAIPGQPIADAAARVPRNIGEPQPAIADLITAGQTTSPVLDAGCGVGQTAVELAGQDHQVMGSNRGRSVR